MRCTQDRAFGRACLRYPWWVGVLCGVEAVSAVTAFVPACDCPVTLPPARPEHMRALKPARPALEAVRLAVTPATFQGGKRRHKLLR
jgi:hypothetical protein